MVDGDVLGMGWVCVLVSRFGFMMEFLIFMCIFDGEILVEIFVEMDCFFVLCDIVF